MIKMNKIHNNRFELSSHEPIINGYIYRTTYESVPFGTEDSDSFYVMLIE